MSTNSELSREVTMGLLATLDEQHRAAVASRDRKLCEAILAQTEALYREAMRSEQEVVNEAKELAEAHSTLFLLNFKGAKSRMENRMKDAQHSRNCLTSRTDKMLRKESSQGDGC